MSEKLGNARDILIYLGLSAFPIASFWLSGSYPDTTFYATLLIVSVLVLFGFKIFHQDTHRFLDWDNNLDGFKLMLVAIGAVSVLAVASWLISNYTKTSLYVPVAQQALVVGALTVPKFWSDVLFQFVLVAFAEESAKAASSLSLYVMLRNAIGEFLSQAVAMIAPIAIWALLHTYQNPSYMGANMWIMVGSAFIAGIIMFAVEKKNGSVLSAILIHAIFNAVIVYTLYGMTASFFLIPVYVIILTAVTAYKHRKTVRNLTL
jgi:hypothetical protein